MGGTSDAPEAREYLLGTDADELRRLGFQHQVWIREAAEGWERGGFRPGHRLLDVGCGPGYATLDLARLVGERGHVTGVDVSERFVGHLLARAAAAGISNVAARVDDVEAMELPEGTLDGAYARWVLCFLRNPERVVEAVSRGLRRGGRFVVHDYSNYPALQLAPASPAFDRVLAAIVASWGASGGDCCVGARLPAMMEAAGLSVVSIRPVVRIARPGSALWEWPRTFFDNYLPTLVRAGHLGDEEREAFERLWAERSAAPGTFLSTPPMVEVVAERR